MKTTAEQIKALKEERADKIKLMDGLIDKAETEKRNLSTEEDTKYKGIKSEVEGYSERLNRLEEKLKREMEEAANTKPVDFSTQGDQSDKDKKDLRKFSMLKVVRSQAPNHFPEAKLEGLEKEMHEEAVKEARANGGVVKGIGVPSIILRSWGEQERRDMTAGTTTNGGFFIQTDVSSDIIDPLRNRLVLAQAGARFLSQLQGNLDIPKNGGVSVAWATENATATESTPTIGRVQLTPKRLAGFSDLSVQLIKQTSWSVENMVRQDYLNAIAVALDLAGLNGTGSGGQPTGILGTAGIGSVAGGTNGLAPDNTHITKLEEEVSIDNADLGSLSYITNPKVRRALKNTAIETGDALRVWDRMDNARPLNGYPAYITNNMPSNLTKGSASGVCSAILFGNFNDLLIGMWGGMDVQSNPYTKLKEGQIEVVAAVYADVAVRRAESFAAMLDALTA